MSGIVRLMRATSIGLFMIGLISVGVLLLSSAAAKAPDTGVPDAGAGADLHGRQVFPSDNAWNLDVSKSPIDPGSDNIIRSIGADRPLHPDFGTVYDGAPMGIPYVVVKSSQKPVPITFTEFADESDRGPYPVPTDAPIEGGANSDGDRHVLVIDRDAWKLYELYHAFPQADGSWRAGSGAIFDLKKGTLRPDGWTSCDAAGLPIFPGLARYDEIVLHGKLTHALRFVVQHSRKAYVPPARHYASRSNDPNLPPMGMRVRLRPDFDTSGFPPQTRVILEGLKVYGMILADNGSNWFINGAPDPRWNDDDLHSLTKVHGRDLQVIRMDGLVTR